MERSGEGDNEVDRGLVGRGPFTGPAATVSGWEGGEGLRIETMKREEDLDGDEDEDVDADADIDEVDSKVGLGLELGPRLGVFERGRFRGDSDPGESELRTIWRLRIIEAIG